MVFLNVGLEASFSTLEVTAFTLIGVLSILRIVQTKDW